jgi:hypothetical protein
VATRVNNEREPPIFSTAGSTLVVKRPTQTRSDGTNKKPMRGGMGIVTVVLVFPLPASKHFDDPLKQEHDDECQDDPAPNRRYPSG